ncbi:oligosaccharide biosynthesis protein Alg14 like-domain-containing protein [Microdochium trichocladiopsis]|uniref:UDP-N-acetylglucosamine transferase subunit ALG14 n=1 Tax=Microdochium trichocladiopsis TaxID=1682393 RepID=A0A9P9BKH6_9PEZI|nr:oligosaccharide biosynthesis protein Alg14 like-domain-containing protein [Microdochium trichocladiopsis]KAH7021239.1 oligosaccharide biosynthesis protein Alg14 like-domain-containing protein [Microdochium trichocladiopsis]
MYPSPHLILDLAARAYTLPHIALRLAFFYLLGTQVFPKARQSTFAAVALSGIGHALDQSVFQRSQRHYTLTQLRPGLKSVVGPPRPTFVEHYTLFVMGSGGHTAEMLSMIERSIRPLGLDSKGTRDFGRTRQLRRYIISHGDDMSVRKVQALEADIAARFAAIGADSGAYDIKLVSRARRVHQSWLSTPASFARSILSIGAALFARHSAAAAAAAAAAAGRSQTAAAAAVVGVSGPRFPGVIVTNGPATAFAVVLVSHLLRMARLVPQTHMHAIYVESFAKVSTLSLTGKLLYMLDLADQFIVQWPRLREKYPRAQLCMYFSVRPADPVVPVV